MRFSTTKILLTLSLLPLATPAFFRAPLKSSTGNTVLNSGFGGVVNNPAIGLGSSSNKIPPNGKTDADENTDNKQPPEIPDFGGPESSEQGSKTTQNAASEPTCIDWGIKVTRTLMCQTTATRSSGSGSAFTPGPASGDAGRNRLGLGWGVGVGVGILGVGALGVF